jgi:hypothetical protein
VPEPPPLSIIGGVPETVSAHRAGVGAAALDVDEELHAAGSRPLNITTIVVKRESLTIAFERNNQWRRMKAVLLHEVEKRASASKPGRNGEVTRHRSIADDETAPPVAAPLR